MGPVDSVSTVVSVPAGQLARWRTDDIAAVAFGSNGDGTPFNFHVRDFEKAAEIVESKGLRVRREGKHGGVVWDPFDNALQLHDHRKSDG